MTKTTLLAAASAVAMLVAGAAQAGTITGSINNGATVNVTANAPYTIASERTNAADTTGAGAFVLANELTTKPTIAAGAQTQNYSVTFTVAGGTIPTASAATLVVDQTASNGGTVGTPAIVQGARDANSITFIVTIPAPTSAAAPAAASVATINGFTLTTTLANSSAENNISFTSATALLAGGVSSPIDNTTATTLVKYAPLFGTFATTANKLVAALPDFKEFKGTPNTLTGTLATDYKYPSNVGTFYAGLNAAAVTAGDIVNGGTVVVAGAQMDKLTPALTTVTGATPVVTANGTTTTFTLDNTQADLLLAGNADLTLTQTGTVANQVAINAGSFTTAFLPTFVSGYTAPASAATIASGSISLDGVNFVAPWVSGSGLAQSVIRLGNNATAASGPVSIRLLNAVKVVNGVSTPVTSSVVYQAGTVPAGSDLQVTSAQLVAAFGDFTRGDFQITVQSSATPLSAKLRNTRDGQTFEQSLGAISQGVIAQ